MGIREQATRNESGILVRLLWDAARGQILIRYRDRESGDDVPNQSALEAFRHPNAFRPA
jgi:hypothetical protein